MGVSIAILTSQSRYMLGQEVITGFHVNNTNFVYPKQALMFQVHHISKFKWRLPTLIPS